MNGKEGVISKMFIRAASYTSLLAVATIIILLVVTTIKIKISVL